MMLATLLYVPSAVESSMRPLRVTGRCGAAFSGRASVLTI
jgi:hypothetical protein